VDFNQWDYRYEYRVKALHPSEKLHKFSGNLRKMAFVCSSSAGGFGPFSGTIHSLFQREILPRPLCRYASRITETFLHRTDQKLAKDGLQTKFRYSPHGCVPPAMGVLEPEITTLPKLGIPSNSWPAPTVRKPLLRPWRSSTTKGVKLGPRAKKATGCWRSP